LQYYIGKEFFYSYYILNLLNKSSIEDSSNFDATTGCDAVTGGNVCAGYDDVTDGNFAIVGGCAGAVGSGGGVFATAGGGETGTGTALVPPGGLSTKPADIIITFVMPLYFSSEPMPTFENGAGEPSGKFPKS
jgi:hypothetical protein